MFENVTEKYRPFCMYDTLLESQLEFTSSKFKPPVIEGWSRYPCLPWRLLALFTLAWTGFSFSSR